MRTFSITLLAILLPAVAAAEPANRWNLQTPTDAGKQLPAKSAARANSCAALGPGFVKVEGTDTCVKIGGSVSVGMKTGR